MPRKMSPDREREYAVLHAYLDFIATNVWGADPASPTHPTNIGKEIVLKFGKSRALDGLRQAAADTVEMLQDKPVEFIQQLDVRLRSAGIPTVSEIRHRHSALFKRIVKRGVVRTETEYLLVNGIVSDLSSAITDEERAVLQGLLEAYETRSA